jgi:Zn-dependent protease
MRPPAFRFSNPIHIDKLTKIGQIRGVDTYIHWSVFLIAALILANVVSRPLVTLVGLACYMSVLLIHEVGHLVAAQRLGCRVDSIKLYPIFGVTYFEVPWTTLDHCIIAWGGVLAQSVIAIPLVLWVEVFGYTKITAVNAVFAILGFFSLGIALFNLLPFPPLDGATAWGLLPALWARKRIIR